MHCNIMPLFLVVLCVGYASAQCPYFHNIKQGYNKPCHHPNDTNGTHHHADETVTETTVGINIKEELDKYVNNIKEEDGFNEEDESEADEHIQKHTTAKHGNKKDITTTSTKKVTHQNTATSQKGTVNSFIISNSSTTPMVNPCNLTFTKCSAKEKYRRFDGSCNNLKNPKWGMAMSFYKRMLDPVYGDGISTPREGYNDTELPNARLLSRKLHPVEQTSDESRSLLTMQFGQFVAHDMSDLLNTDIDINCCSANNSVANKLLCFSIIYPQDDPFVKKTGIDCQAFTRTLTDKLFGCNNNSEPARQINRVTAYLDLSTVYGNDEETCKALRSMKRGQFLIAESEGAKFPTNEVNPNICFCNKPKDEVCYKTGDTRSNQSPHLAIVQTIFMREHNRLAEKLEAINPSWDDEKLFQEARRINIAQYQYIIYYEWLPEILGWKNLMEHDVIFPNSREYVNDYSPEVNPAVINEHATAAFRHYHTQVSGILHLMNDFDDVETAEPINKWLDRPQLLYNVSKVKQLTLGMLSQRAEKSDKIYAKEIIDSVFKCRGVTFLKDMRTLDIQRDRDHGLAYYNDYRDFCSIKAATCFDDYLDFIPKKTVKLLKKLYKNHESVDLSVGGALETHWNGALVGPTYLCILIQQFKQTRMADRFFFEHHSAGFTRDQLHEIRKSSISRLFCDNGDGIERVYMNGFLNTNEDRLLPCNILPSVDLLKWKKTKY